MVQTMCSCEHTDSNEQQDGEHSFQDWIYETEKLLSELVPSPHWKKVGVFLSEPEIQSYSTF